MFYAFEAVWCPGRTRTNTSVRNLILGAHLLFEVGPNWQHPVVGGAPDQAPMAPGLRATFATRLA